MRVWKVKTRRRWYIEDWCILTNRVKKFNSPASFNWINLANELKEIPKEYIVYLQTSYEEFEKTKEQYLKWLIGNNQPYYGTVKGGNTDGKNLKVPELIVKIPLDENEENRIEPEDW